MIKYSTGEMCNTQAHMYVVQSKLFKSLEAEVKLMEILISKQLR